MRPAAAGILGPGTALVLAMAAAAWPSTGPVVSVVRSDDAGLPAPVPADQSLDYAAHVRPMVRAAVERSGLRERVQAARPGPDGVVDVVCKVNIVHVDHVPGDITDSRVVKALLEAVHEWAPGARLTIAEGGVWIPPERKDLIALLDRVEVGDGFEAAGYRALLRDPDLAGADLRIVDLNYDDAVAVEPPGGGLSAESYWVPRTVREAEVLISVPVLKITGVVGMTVAVKNLIGIAPGLKYGWPKLRGWPPESGSPGLWHTHQTLDETIVDLAGVAGVDFAVVDGIVGMERERIRSEGGFPVRVNTIVAGPDLLAVDAVAARLMGLNPADMEFLQVGQRRGLGVADLDRLRVRHDLEDLVRRFEKKPHDENSRYGMGNRTWLLKGPIPVDADAGIDPAVTPRPGAGGWSGPVYFHDDRIDLDRHYSDPTHCVVYAYAEFDAPRDEPAELWVGSDEGLTVWIDGRQVHRFRGRRRHFLPCERVPIHLTKGRHRVLVRAEQRRGDFDFSLKLSEAEEDERYDGNAVLGLRWRTPEGAGPATEVRVQQGRRTLPWYAETLVDETRRGHLLLSAILPAHGQTAWAGMERAVMWANPMELSIDLTGPAPRIITDNLSAFRLNRTGPLAGLRSSAAVSIDGSEVALGGGDQLCLARDEAGSWRAGDPSACESVPPVATAAATLANDDLTGPWYDTALGNWFCDSILFATGAEIAFQNNAGIRQPLEEGQITIGAIFRMNFRDELYTFELTGAEVLDILEFDARDGKERPMQVAGLSYAVDRSRPEGRRVIEHDLDLQRTYKLAAEDYLVLRSDRFFDREVEWTNTEVQIVDAQIRYAGRQGTVTPPPLGRIRRLDAPAGADREEAP